jgi:hypothetical protein
MEKPAKHARYETLTVVPALPGSERLGGPLLSPPFPLDHVPDSGPPSLTGLDLMSFTAKHLPSGCSQWHRASSEFFLLNTLTDLRE